MYDLHGNTCSLAGQLRSHIPSTAFASDLRKRLPTDKDDSTASQTLLSEIHKHIQSLERSLDKPQHGMLHDEELETEGTKLWNVCTRLGREDPAKSSSGLKLVLRSRVLAFQLLHSCLWSSKSTSHTVFHLLGLALRVAKLCIGLHAPI